MSDGWRIEERPRTIPYLPVLRACPFLRMHSVSLSVSPSLFIRFLASHGTARSAVGETADAAATGPPSVVYFKLIRAADRGRRYFPEYKTQCSRRPA